MCDGFLDDRIAKAIVCGVKYRDFTHWKKCKAHYGYVSFKLDIGYNYRLIAVPSHGYLDETEYQLFYKGRYMFCAGNSRISLSSNIAVMEGKCYTVHFKFNPDMDLDEYAREIEGKVRKDRAIVKKDGEKIITDFFYSKEEYRGIVDEPDEQGFDEGFIDAAMEAVKLQRYSALGRYRYTKDHSIGPADFSISYARNTEYSSQIHVKVRDIDRIPISFWMEGILTSDEDGILIRGLDAAYTIVTRKKDMERFRNNHSDLVGIRDYIRTHPVPSYKDIIDGRDDHIVSLVKDSWDWKLFCNDDTKETFIRINFGSKK